MTNFKKLFLVFFLITSFSNRTSQAMEVSEKNQLEETEQADENYLVIEKKWSEDENYLYITINGVVWSFGPFNAPDENEESQNNSNTTVQEKTA